MLWLLSSGCVWLLCSLLLLVTALAGLIALREASRAAAAEQHLSSLRTTLIEKRLAKWVSLPSGKRIFIVGAVEAPIHTRTKP